MKRCILLGILAACLVFAQADDTLTNQTVIKLIQAGVAPATIIKTISSADKVSFSFLPSDLQLLSNARVPDDVIRVMAAKDRGRPLPSTATVPVQAVPPTKTAKAAPSAVAQAAPAPVAETAPARTERAPKPVVQKAPVSQSSYADDSGDLRRGRIELRGFGGGNGGPGRYPFPNISYSVGGEFAIGLARYLAATGTYSYDHAGSVKFGSLETDSASFHEFMGGVRVPFPNHTVVTPYVQGSLGAIRVVGSTNVLGISATDAYNKFAFAPGGGIDFKINHHTGLGIDIRAIKGIGFDGSSLDWYYRATGAAFFRF